MSNPLIRPGDPRFVRPSITDAEGKNVFAEPEGSADAGAAGEAGENLYAASLESVPYQPRYEVSQNHRGVLLLVLSLVALAGTVMGVTTLSGVFMTGWMLSALAIVPAACAWLLGAKDIRAMKLGAMDPSGLTMTRVAMWLGAIGVLGSIGMVTLVVIFAIYFVMQIF